MSPIVEELTPVPDVAATLRRFAAWPDVVLFESARPHERLGRYSFLTADPFESVGIQEAPFGLDPFRRVREQHARFQTETVPELPPFQGGAAGVLSYELGGCWERIPRPRHDEFQLPAARLGLYDWVIAWDHVADQAWIISHGFPETEPARRRDRAASRLADVRQHLQTDESNAADRPTGSKRLE